jgi:hypothetical protein
MATMQRLRGILLASMTSIALLLAFVALASGVASFFRADKFEYVSSSGRLGMAISRNGRLDLLYHAAWPGEPGFTHIPSSTRVRGGTDEGRRLLGIGGGRLPSGAVFINLPYWLLTILFALPAALGIRSALRRRHAMRGLCPACGYDMRANPARCSECGHAPTTGGLV